MSKCDIVLDDNLYRIYHLFKNADDNVRRRLSIDTISKIFKFSGNSVLTNIAQIERLSIDVNTALRQKLLHQKSKRYSLEELSKETNYKIILTDDPTKNKFPFVNLNQDQIEMVMGGFVMKNQSRDKAISHLKSLCANTKEIIVYDKYFSVSSKEDSNIDILKSLLPQSRNIKITYHKDNYNRAHISSSGLARLCSELPLWTLQDKILESHHDRYLILDNHTEIILTSGFDYLSDTSKEITYIIRTYSGRF